VYRPVDCVLHTRSERERERGSRHHHFFFSAEKLVREQLQKLWFLSRVCKRVARAVEDDDEDDENWFYYRPPPPLIDRQSLEHLVDFIDNVDSHKVRITELRLSHVELSHPADSGLNVLSAFFARSDSTLTDVLLDECDFGRQEVACLVLEAFHTNRTITDLEIRSGVAHLEGTALGNSLADLMQKKAPQFKRLDLYLTELNVATIRASVHFNQHCERIETLKSLHLQRCGLGDEGIRLIVNALVGNTIMESLILTENSITAAGLPDITRMIESMPRLYTIYVERQPRSLCSWRHNPTLCHDITTNKVKCAKSARLSRQYQSSSVCQYHEQFDVQSAIEPCRSALDSSATNTTACNQHGAQDLAQGHYKVCHGRQQQCWSECHVQTVPGSTGVAGKAN
jgi:hypothetical protein